MRDRDKIEKDSRDANIPYEELILETLLDIREQNESIIEHLKHNK